MYVMMITRLFQVCRVCVCFCVRASPGTDSRTHTHTHTHARAADLLAGATGGPTRGVTNHFIPTSDKLFPGWRWKSKVLLSDVGVGVTALLLWRWAAAEQAAAAAAAGGAASAWTGVWWVAAVYWGPYLGARGGG